MTADDLGSAAVPRAEAGFHGDLTIESAVRQVLEPAAPDKIGDGECVARDIELIDRSSRQCHQCDDHRRHRHVVLVCDGHQLFERRFRSVATETNEDSLGEVEVSPSIQRSLAAKARSIAYEVAIRHLVSLSSPTPTINQTLGVGRVDGQRMTLRGSGARRDEFAAIVSVVVWLIRGDAPGDGDPGVMRAEHYRHELSGLRARAEADLARNYIELQQVRNSGLVGRTEHVERVIRALESELITLERLGEGIHRSL